MDILRQQVQRARRRLTVAQFLRVLPWYLAATLLVAAIAVAVRKYWPLPVDRALWDWSWLGGAIALGVLSAGVWTLATRRALLDAAIEIDRRFGLKERVSSTLAMDDEELSSEAGQALVNDTLRRIDRIEVAEEFQVAMQRRSLVPVALAGVAFVVALLVAERGSDNTALANAATTQEKKQIKVSTDSLRRKMVERQQQARELGLKDAEDLFRKIEEASQKVGDKDLDRKQALVKLNDVAKQLEGRREKLGGEESIRQQLNQMKMPNNGPAKDIATAMKNGDFKKALEEVEKLQQKLAKGELGEEDKKKLGEQLAEMKEKMQKMAEAHRQMQQDLKERIKQAREQGNPAEAEKLQKQLDQLAQQAPGMEKMRQMAEMLGECAQCMEQGKGEQAAQSLNKLAAELDKLAQNAEEMALLENALDQIADAKDAMGCDQCGGAGCKACQGGGFEEGFGEGEGQGDGLGKGRGQGRRPIEETDTGFYDTKVKQNVGKGGGVMTGQVEGPNSKGNVTNMEISPIEASRREARDPLTGQRLPRHQREHAKEYFDGLREGTP